MIDSKLCFSATNEIIKIANSIADAYKPKEEYETEVELVHYIHGELSDIINSCSSDVREGYAQHIAERFPEWIRDEAYKLIRLREIKGTLSKMRSSLKPSVDNYIRE